MRNRPLRNPAADSSAVHGLSGQVANMLVVLVGAAMLGGCAYERPQSTITPGLDTGITASSGGGMMTPVRPLGPPSIVQ